MSSPSTERWEQPSFTSAAVPMPLAGVVLAPGQQYLEQAPGPQEQRLRLVLQLIWPIALVAAILTGSWLSLIVLAVILRAVLKHRVQELRLRRRGPVPATLH